MSRITVYVSFLEAASKLEVFMLQLDCLMGPKENVDLPFEVGQEAESRSFIPGFRGAWFRCKVSINLFFYLLFLTL